MLSTDKSVFRLPFNQVGTLNYRITIVGKLKGKCNPTLKIGRITNHEKQEKEKK